MLKIYTSYKCRSCSNEFILLSDEVDKMNKGRYIACPYCNSKRILKVKDTDDLRECMNERAYKRDHGAIVQIR
jgi:DNA-directed RNA polymerase subunit RPC12/RpoP